MGISIYSSLRLNCNDTKTIFSQEERPLFIYRLTTKTNLSNIPWKPLECIRADAGGGMETPSRKTTSLGPMRISLSSALTAGFRNKGELLSGPHALPLSFFFLQGTQIEGCVNVHTQRLVYPPGGGRRKCTRPLPLALACYLPYPSTRLRPPWEVICMHA